jgi:hypothetical protein
VIWRASSFLPKTAARQPAAWHCGARRTFKRRGWDTVYSGVLNNIERPVAPVLIVRVQTDWYAHDTEFRYVLQAGEGIHAGHSLPIGQVFFVPREDVTLRDSTNEELEAFRQARRDFQRDKAAVTLATPYGLQYSPHYARKSRSPQT